MRRARFDAHGGLYAIVLELIVIAMSVLSCTIPHGTIERVNASVESQYSAPVEVRVYLEGDDGNYITGALVVATNPGNAAKALGFSLAQGCYYTAFDDRLSGSYHIAISSSLLTSDKTMDIDHEIPASQPTFTSLQDSGGNDGLTGQKLAASQAIAVAWEAIDKATLYSVLIMRGSSLVFSRNTSQDNIIISENALPAGTYSLSINAQAVSGDPLFKSSAWYSASQSQGASVQFVTR